MVSSLNHPDEYVVVVYDQYSVLVVVLPAGIAVYMQCIRYTSSVAFSTDELVHGYYCSVSPAASYVLSEGYTPA